MKCLLIFATLSIFMIFNGYLATAETLKVTTIINEPYVVLRGDHKRITNRSEITGDLLDGYLIDLLRSLSDYIKFDYNIHIVKDGYYGTVNSTKHWNGMIGEVMRGDADLALADLTVTSKREEVIDFSYPFMTTGIGLLVKRPPYFEHDNSSDTDCKTRTMLVYPVSSVRDLPYQNEVSYGAVASGSTFSFFKNSLDDTYSRIGEKMKSNESMLCKNTREAKERVKNSNGKYVFFMESAAIEYLAGLNCDFMQLGANIDRKSYGIGMRKDFHMKTEINMGVLALQENGVLDKLKKKWFPEPKQCDNHLDPVYARNALNLVLNSLK